MKRIPHLLRAGAVASALTVLSGCVAGDGMMGLPFASTDGPTDALNLEATLADAAPDSAGFGAPSALGYAAVEDGGFPLAAIPTGKIDPQYLRQQVPYAAGEYEPGTVIVDTPNRFLYVIEAGGTAMRYGISVGGAGFSWAGEARVGAKRHWPRWNPPQEMIDRKPELEPYRNGMDAGLTNPLGARALYLHQGGRDTLYRLHGTPEWWTIGTAVSAGCIRLMNQDVVDLYERVPMGARVVVKQGNERLVGEEELVAEAPVFPDPAATASTQPMSMTSPSGAPGAFPTDPYATQPMPSWQQPAPAQTMQQPWPPVQQQQSMQSMPPMQSMPSVAGNSGAMAAVRY